MYDNVTISARGPVSRAFLSTLCRRLCRLLPSSLHEFIEVPHKRVSYYPPLPGLPAAAFVAPPLLGLPLPPHDPVRSPLPRYRTSLRELWTIRDPVAALPANGYPEQHQQ